MRFIVALIIAVQIIRHLVEIAALAERRRGSVIAVKELFEIGGRKLVSLVVLIFRRHALVDIRREQRVALARRHARLQQRSLYCSPVVMSVLEISKMS